MFLPEDVKRIIDILNQSSYKAYAVGGCVRDAIMGREISDYDITTSALPSEVEAVLDANGIKYFETGMKHGTITAVINHIPYEITTFRTDGKYLDNRHPESVLFVSDVKDDLSRRDFTVNAIAYNDNEGFVDLLGGRNDIERKIIKAVGDSDKRFQEDALRIMRALRFASQLGFDIEENTKKAIFKNKELLKNIAVERIYNELIKLLLGENCEKVLIEYREIIAFIIPELEACFDYPQNSKWHIYDIYTHIVKSVALTEQKDYLRLAMLFHDIGKPLCKTTDEKGDHFYAHAEIGCEKAKAILKRFKVSNEIYNNVLTLVKVHDYHLSIKPAKIKMYFRDFGEELTLELIDFQIADLKTHNMALAQDVIEKLETVKKTAFEIINNKEPYNIKDLDINGFDLMALGYKGKEISEILEYLANEIIIHPEYNEKDKLKEIIQSFQFSNFN